MAAQHIQSKRVSDPCNYVLLNLHPRSAQPGKEQTDTQKSNVGHGLDCVDWLPQLMTLEKFHEVISIRLHPDGWFFPVRGLGGLCGVALGRNMA